MSPQFLPRSAPETQGIPSEAIQDFVTAVEENIHIQPPPRQSLVSQHFH